MFNVKILLGLVRMKKRTIISLSIFFGIIALILLSFWTLFGLKSISVDCETTTKNLTVNESEIVEASGLKKGSCVLFESKKKARQNIENYVSKNENFAYINIINIETKFPNKIVIHIAEREELFAVSWQGKFLICDRDFVVLRICDTYVSQSDNAILLNNLTVKNESVSVGDALDINQVGMKKLYSACVANNRNLSEILSKFESMTLSNYQDEVTKKDYVSLTMETFSGRKIIVNNIDFELTEKMQKLFAVESSLFSLKTDSSGNCVDENGNVIYVKLLETNEYVAFDSSTMEETEKIALTYSLLSGCAVKIDNLTLTNVVSRDGSLIYYSLIKIA